MTTREQARWKEWADRLRQSMMADLTPYITKSIAEIVEETATQRSPSVLATRRFWTTVQTGEQNNHILARAGFQIEFSPSEGGNVESVTLRLNDTWSRIMQHMIDQQLLITYYRMENRLSDLAVAELNADKDSRNSANN